jgi:hypothetical protein
MTDKTNPEGVLPLRSAKTVNGSGRRKYDLNHIPPEVYGGKNPFLIFCPEKCGKFLNDRENFRTFSGRFLKSNRI